MHLIASELFAALDEVGHHVRPGDLGENVTTAGLVLEALAVGSMLRLRESALVAVTGLRNPCAQIDAFQPGLLKRVSYRGEVVEQVPRAGVMGVVVLGGVVRVGDQIEVGSPPRRQLESSGFRCR